MAPNASDDEPQRELSRSDVEELAAAGILRRERVPEVTERLRRGVEWRDWGAGWTCTVGSVLLLAGIVFFFAWNWRALSPLVRFAVLEGAVVLAVAAAVIAGLRGPAGRWFLTAATVLTGVLIAVFGQVYQTGADAFEVFALWAVLALAWAVVGRFAPLWLLWCAVAQTALATYFGQVPVPAGVLSWAAAFVVMGWAAAAALGVVEWRVRKPGAGAELVRVVLVASAALWFGLAVWELLFEYRSREAGALTRAAVVLCWLSAVAGGAWFHTYVRPSLTSVGVWLLSGAAVTVAWTAEKLVFSSTSSAPAWLVSAAVAIGVLSVTAFLISKAAQEIEQRRAERAVGEPTDDEAL